MNRNSLAAPIAALSMALAWAGAALAVPVTLAENVHVNGQGAGNNNYSYPSVIGAENFSLSSAWSIVNISHVGHHSPSIAQPTSIDWWIYANGAGSPGLMLFSGNSTTYATAVEGTASGYELTRYSIGLSGVNLGPGNYWVGFHNNSGAGGDPHWTFASSGTSFDGISAVSNNSGASWSVPYPGSNMTFRVVGDNAASVPEPVSLALFAMGLFGLGLSRRRSS